MVWGAIDVSDDNTLNIITIIYFMHIYECLCNLVQL